MSERLDEETAADEKEARRIALAFVKVCRDRDVFDAWFDRTDGLPEVTWGPEHTSIACMFANHYLAIRNPEPSND